MKDYIKRSDYLIRVNYYYPVVTLRKIINDLITFKTNRNCFSTIETYSVIEISCFVQVLEKREIYWMVRDNCYVKKGYLKEPISNLD